MGDQSILEAKALYDSGNYSDSIVRFIGLAEIGNSDAMYYIGECYFYGNGVEKNESSAVRWYIKAAENDDAQACYDLGFCFYSGDGIKKDYEKTFFYWKKSAELGNENGQYMLGLAYLEGTGTDPNEQLSVEWIQKSAMQGCADALYEMGTFYEEGKESFGIHKDLEQAFKSYQQAAKQDNIDAQFKLGFYYSQGIVVAKNVEEAFIWFEKAAENGHSVAQYNLGLSYSHGLGVEKNDEKAVYWWTKASEQGDADAQFELGLCYVKGRETENNITVAFQWLEKAAEQGVVKAQLVVGEAYHYGRLIPADSEKAQLFLNKAAQNGEEYAVKLLQDISNAVPQPKEATTPPKTEFGKELLNRAMAEPIDKNLISDLTDAIINKKNTDALPAIFTLENKGYLWATGTLASVYFSGDYDIEPNPEYAYYCIKKAVEGYSDNEQMAEEQRNFLNVVEEWYLPAKNGDPHGMFMLGMLLSGDNTPAPDSESAKWLKKASAAGDKDASHSLVLLYRDASTNLLTKDSRHSTDEMARLLHEYTMEMFRYQKIGADQGDIEAAYKYGENLFNGEIPKEVSGSEGRDIPQALRYLTIAANGGNADAMSMLGDYYQVFEDNPSESFRWNQLAAENGNADAQNEMVRLLFKENKQEAFKYAKMSMDQGNMIGKLHYAMLLNHEAFSNPNPRTHIDQALKLYQEIIDSNSSETVGKDNERITDVARRQMDALLDIRKSLGESSAERLRGVGTKILQKDKTTVLFLCIFLGLFGVHRFYVGKIKTGILYLLSGGIFGIGWIVDIISIICGTFTEKNTPKNKTKREEKRANSYQTVRNNASCAAAARAMCSLLNDDSVVDWLRQGSGRSFKLNGGVGGMSLLAYETIDGLKKNHYVAGFLFSEHGYPNIPDGVIYGDVFIEYIMEQIRMNCPKVYTKEGNPWIVLMPGR